MADLLLKPLRDYLIKFLKRKRIIKRLEKSKKRVADEREMMMEREEKERKKKQTEIGGLRKNPRE